MPKTYYNYLFECSNKNKKWETDSHANFVFGILKIYFYSRKNISFEKKQNFIIH